MAGLEPATFWSRTRRATKLRYIPIRLALCTTMTGRRPRTERTAGLRYAPLRKRPLDWRIVTDAGLPLQPASYQIGLSIRP